MTRIFVKAVLLSSTMRILVILCAVTMVVFSSCAVNKRKPRLNVVVILADDLGWNDVGFNNPDIQTPNIDGLANSGIILNQSYAQPMCSPSRTALMTGVYPFRVGLSHLVITASQEVCVPLNRTFLSQVFQENGYATHIVGKWHLGMCNWACTPNYRGFDSFYGFYNGRNDYYTKNSDGGFDFRDGTAVDKSANGTHSTYLFRNRIKQIVNNHNTEKPLFLYVAFQEPHDPLQALPEYHKLYPNITNEDRRNFSALVTGMDDTVGILVQALKDKGIYNNTLIVFSADNGANITEGGNNYPLRGTKSTIFEGGTRAVSFVHGPMFKNVGVRYDGIIHMVDWMSTLTEAAGLKNKVPDQDGVSQWKPLLTLSPSNRNEFVYNMDLTSDPVTGKSAIRVGDYKLILGSPGRFLGWTYPDGREEFISDPVNNSTEEKKYLFNLRDDPAERNNIYNQNPEIVQRLKERLDYHKTRFVTPNFPPKTPKANPANWGGVWSPGWCTPF